MSSEHPSTFFDVLEGQIGAVGDAFAEMADQLDQLKDVNDTLTRFNESFGAFMFGMASNASALRFPQTPSKTSFERHQTRSKSKPSTADLGTISFRPTEPNLDNSPNATTTTTTTTKARPVKKFTSKIDIRQIIDRLPIKFREQEEPNKNIRSILKVLRLNPGGLNMPAIVAAVNLPKYKVTECLNALVHSKDVLKYNPKGQICIYQFDPARYPSTQVR
ncbi:hypothetical protein DFQ28_007476, partial [Apophysomyces sp. BC1034]